MSGLRLLFLGPPHIECEGESIKVDTRKAIALLAYLALTKQSHSRDALAALFWPDYEPKRAYANLRRTLWALNKTLHGQWIDADAETIGLNPDAAIWVDVDTFHRLLDDCSTHNHPSSEACTRCIAPLTEAITLVRGTFLAGFGLDASPEFEDWQFFQTESLRREQSSALERLVRAHTAAGECEMAIGYARRWLALDPLEEEAHRQLMRLYAWSGQRNAALHQYRQCSQLLEEQLGVSPQEETRQLAETIQANRLPPPMPAQEFPLGQAAGKLIPQAAGDKRLPEADGLTGPRHNLPPQLTTFVGRQEELARIAALLADPACHLLTLVGPGGIGKTRLALQYAISQVEAFADGVCFVPLAAVHAPDLLTSTMAGGLGFSFFGQKEPTRQLLGYLSSKRLLLVLDNFEHLIAGAGLVADLIATAPGVKILITSRERLNLRDEWVMEVQGMRFPGEQQVDHLEEYGAVQLFLQNARRADVGFSLSDEKRLAVARICRLVQGMPLGIELAASWVRALSCQEIAQEIERNLDFLTTSMRDAPERHRSLRVVFEYSWSLLSSEEQAVFSRLSVFRGGFRKEAARRVSGAFPALLSTLVDKSLLRRNASGRYEIHEVLRQYAAEKLAQSPDAERETFDRHCAAYADFLMERRAELRGPRQTILLKEIGEEIENVRLGWIWAVAHRLEEPLDQYVDALFAWYEIRSWFQEGEEAFGGAVQQLQNQASVLLARVLGRQGWFAYRLYRFDQGRQLFQQAHALLSDLGDTEELARCNLLAMPTWSRSEMIAAEGLLRDMLSHFQRQGATWEVADTLLGLSALAWIQEDMEASRQYGSDSLSLYRQLGDRRGMAQAFDNLAGIAQAVGDYRQAKEYYRESLGIARDLGFRWGIAWGLDHTGYICRLLGEYAEAERYHWESLEVSQDMGDQLGIAGSYDNLGLVAFDRGDTGRARELFEQALAIRQRFADQESLTVSLENLGNALVLLGEIEQGMRFLEEALSIRRQHDRDWSIARSLCEIGDAHLVAGAYQRARDGFCEALAVAWDIRTLPPYTIRALAGLAAAMAGEGQKQRALEVLSFALRQNVLEYRDKCNAERLYSKLASEFDRGRLAAVQTRAAARTMEDVVGELLAGCSHLQS